MRRFILILILMILSAGFCAIAQESPVEARCTRHTMRHQGMEREYWVYLPEGIKAEAPLVLALHGYGGSAVKGKPGLMDTADKYGFAVCYPQGAEDAKGKTCWNVGYPFQKGLKTNDVDFLCDLAGKLQKDFRLSAENTFLTGMSNGGEMCYLMAEKRPNAFKAIASVAGLILEEMDRDYRTAVPFMEIHGTADRTSKWEGDPQNEGGWGAYLAVPVAVSYIIAANGCVSETKTVLPRKRNEVILHQFQGGKPAWKGGPDSEVWFYEIIGGKHTWAEDDMDTFEEIWRFFSRYVE